MRVFDLIPGQIRKDLESPKEINGRPNPVRVAAALAAVDYLATIPGRVRIDKRSGSRRHVPRKHR